MPPKGTRKSRRRTATFGEDGKFINRPSIKNAPRAVNPTEFDTLVDAVESAKRLSRKLGVRSRSSTRGGRDPGGGRIKPKSMKGGR